MRTITRLGTWQAVVEGFDEEVVRLAERLRELVLDIDPDATEVPRAGEGSVAYGVGEKKMSEAYCYLMPQRDRVNLGFYHGVSLPDPAGVLEGSGARLRHVKVRPADDGTTPTLAVLRDLVVASRADRVAALGA